MGISLGIGIFHSGVEINGREYSYGGHEFAYSGVFDIVPRSAAGAVFRESISLGTTQLSANEIQQIIDELSDQFTGNSYHPLRRNCNSFSEELCRRLVNKGIPGYVNRLANLGSSLSCIIPQYGLRVLGILPPTSGDDVHNKDDDANSENSTKRSFSAFSGSGNSLSDDPSSDDDSSRTSSFSFSDDSRRERAANAAYKRMTVIGYTTSSELDAKKN